MVYIYFFLLCWVLSIFCNSPNKQAIFLSFYRRNPEACVKQLAQGHGDAITELGWVPTLSDSKAHAFIPYTI